MDKGLHAGVAVSLIHVKTKWKRKADVSSPTAGDAATADPLGGRMGTVDEDHAGLDAVIKEVDTAKAQWRRLRRVTKMMMMMRGAGLSSGSGMSQMSKLGALTTMMTSGDAKNPK